MGSRLNSYIVVKFNYAVTQLFVFMFNNNSEKRKSHQQFHNRVALSCVNTRVSGHLINIIFMQGFTRYVFTFTVCICGFKSFAQNSQCDSFPIIGEWKVCISENLSKPCEKGIVTYDFKKDGSFILKGVKVHYADNVVFTGKWTLVENVLNLECSYNSKERPAPMALNIIFSDHNRFYHLDEPLPGWTMYQIFQKNN